MSNDDEKSKEEAQRPVPRPLFRPFTSDTLAGIDDRVSTLVVRDAKQQRSETFHVLHDIRRHPHPHLALKTHMRLPPFLADNFPRELIGIPIVDIDKFYDTRQTFMVISKGKNIFRFSSTKSLWLFSPFNRVRRVAIQVLVHPIFNFLVISTILVNCVIMTFPDHGEVNESGSGTKNNQTHKTLETIFTSIYTLEFLLKVIASGFVFEVFTYLRDPWNWLDFTVIGIACITLSNIDLGNFSAVRAFRVLRALKTVAVIPGLKTIVGAVMKSVKNLRDVAFLTLFALSVFALLGSQLYMGLLSQKCVRDGPLNMTDEDYFSYINDSGNWYKDSSGKAREWKLCGNYTETQQCPKNHTCLPNIGPNPNLGYTSFDTFPMAMLSSFRLTTQDYWEGLYHMILATAGPWHIFFFILVIFLGSFYLINLILAIVAMSYDALHQQAEKEKEDIAAEEAAIAAEEEAIEAEEKAMDAKEAMAAKEEAMAAEEISLGSNKEADDSSVQGAEDIKRNSGYFSEDKCNSSDNSIQGTESIADSITRTEKNAEAPRLIHTNNRDKKLVSRSLPASPYFSRRFKHRRSSTINWQLRRHHRDYKSCAVDTFESIKEAFPYADDSKTTSPTSEAASVADDINWIPSHLRRPSFLSYTKTYRRSSFTKDNQLTWHSRNINRFCLENSDPVDYPTERRLSVCNPDDGMYIDSHGKMTDMRGSPVYEGKLSFKERAEICCTQFIDNYCVWDCCKCWIRAQNLISLFVFNRFMEHFITFCIVLNTLFMAIDHPHIQSGLHTFLMYGNHFFTGIFAFEAGLKLLALSPKFYFNVVWNLFDFCIVGISVVDIFLGSDHGWSVLRSFRLLRVFKLAKAWPTLNLLTSIMLQTCGALANLTFVLAMIIFIFAVLGMQLFGKKYHANIDNFPPKEIPRWKFQDFLHSFMIVFRVLCGEWVESMWDCLLVADWSCIPYFLATVVFGNLVMLNLFLALLLSSFGVSNLSHAKKLQEAIDRFSNLYHSLKQIPRQIRKGTEDKDARVLSEESEKLDIYVDTESRLAEKQVSLKDADSEVTGSKQDLKRHDAINAGEFHEESYNQSDKNSSYSEEHSKNTDSITVKTPPQCCPKLCYVCCCANENTAFMRTWMKLRTKILLVADHRHFETFAILMILISSFSLTLEDVHLFKRPMLQEILLWMDMIFTFLFLLEMLIKWLAFGLKEYFRNVWCWLDFIIVLVSLIDLVASFSDFGHISIFKILRTLRALRPLRALSRFEGMKIVVNSFVHAIPAIFNVLLVCLMLWLIFAILGVQLFGGKFGACMEIGERVNASRISNKTQCLEQDLIWHNPKINFDNVLYAYLALFQVATFKGWIAIMDHAVDSTTFEGQPKTDNNTYMYFYFVLFIIFGAFFTLNLFIGVLIDNFNDQRKKIKGGILDMFMTEDQKKYYNALKKMGAKKPTKAIPRPKVKIQAFAFDIVTNKKFDMVVMMFICLNMVAMSCDISEPGKTRKMLLDNLNIFFIAVFTAECALKLFALRFFYFKEPWNIFDFIIVILSILSIAVKDVLENYMVSPTLLRVVRVVKIGRVLRLVKGAKGIRTLLFALLMSLPALFNICLLLFLVMFIYAIFGMFLFKDIPLQDTGINANFNFQTFGNSMILLFQLSTSAGWHDILAGLMGTENCLMTTTKNAASTITNVTTTIAKATAIITTNVTAIIANATATAATSSKSDKDIDLKSRCVEPNLAIVYLVSYVFICFLIIINMYIAVILENYSQATDDVQEGLTDDDYDMYYEIWQKFDPLGTQFIKFSVLEDFIDALEEPLQIPKPNKCKIVLMNIPICEGNMIYCVDILDALTKDFFKRKGRTIEETAEMEDIIPKATGIYKPISTTFWRYREIYCATIIQVAWKRFHAEAERSGSTNSCNDKQ